MGVRVGPTGLVGVGVAVVVGLLGVVGVGDMVGVVVGVGDASAQKYLTTSLILIPGPCAGEQLTVKVFPEVGSLSSTLPNATSL